MRFALIALVCAFLTACSPRDLERTALTNQEQALVRATMDDIYRQNGASLVRKTPPQLAGQIPAAVKAIQTILPKPPYKLSMSHANWSLTGETRVTNAVYIVEGRPGWALAQFGMETRGGRTVLTGFHVAPLPGDPRKASFSLADAKPAGWIVLALMAMVIGVIVAALIRIWRSALFRRRWLWTIGALVGVTALKLNWATGEWAFNPIMVQLFGISAAKQPVYAPWVLGVSIPIVALIVLFRQGEPVTENASA